MLQANPLTPAPEVERAKPVKLVVDLDANVVRAGQRIVRVAPLGAATLAKQRAVIGAEPKRPNWLCSSPTARFSPLIWRRLGRAGI
jgi:hypothetical protein